MKTFLLLSFALLFPPFVFSVEVSITMDDPNVEDTPLLTPEERDERILVALDQNSLKAALFVCRMRVDNTQGKAFIVTFPPEVRPI